LSFGNFRNDVLPFGAARLSEFFPNHNDLRAFSQILAPDGLPGRKTGPEALLGVRIPADNKWQK